MPINYKVLGQSAPLLGVDANLYTVPASTEAIVSTLTITNVTASPASARVYVRPNGAAISLGNAVLYDVPVAANSIAAFTLGLTLDATDIVTVRSSVGGALTFQLFGSEIS